MSHHHHHSKRKRTIRTKKQLSSCLTNASTKRQRGLCLAAYQRGRHK